MEVTAVVIVAVVIRINLINCMLGGGICCIVRCGGDIIVCIGSYLTHHHQ